MRVILVTNARLPAEKAQGIQVMKMAEAFARQGVDVILTHPRRAQTRRMGEVHDIWAYYGIEKSFQIKTLPSLDPVWPRALFRRPRTRLRLYVQAISYAFAVCVWLLFRRSGQRELIYSRDRYSLMLLTVLRRLIPTPIFFEAHGASSGLARLRRRFLGLVVITPSLRDLYAAAGVRPERILVAADGVDLGRSDEPIERAEARQRLGIPLDRKVVCYTGQLFAWKGVTTLVRSARHLDPDTLLLIVGGMEHHVERTKRLTEVEGLANVRFEGFVAPTRVREYLAAADILVLPNSASKPISASYTSPLKLFEYMAARRPIVASDLPSLRAVLTPGRNAVLVAPDDPMALATGVKSVLDDATLASRLADQAFRDVRQYTWDERARRILEFVAKVQAAGA